MACLCFIDIGKEQVCVPRKRQMRAMKNVEDNFKEPRCGDFSSLRFILYILDPCLLNCCSALYIKHMVNMCLAACETMKYWF